MPAHGFGAMDILETEAAWRFVSLRTAFETAPPPPTVRAMGLAFADAVRGTSHDSEATLADRLSVLLDATGYRTMGRVDRGKTPEERIKNMHELIASPVSFSTFRRRFRPPGKWASSLRPTATQTRRVGSPMSRSHAGCTVPAFRSAATATGPLSRLHSSKTFHRNTAHSGGCISQPEHDGKLTRQLVRRTGAAATRPTPVCHTQT